MESTVLEEQRLGSPLGYALTPRSLPRPVGASAQPQPQSRSGTERSQQRALTDRTFRRLTLVDPGTAPLAWVSFNHALTTRVWEIQSESIQDYNLETGKLGRGCSVW